ncbi:hypothetical protein HBB16_15965 [Pseudonocardia sp. MCCB 268]|nr:hypothetical protein [Pseudonocardia cytotoxica]
MSEAMSRLAPDRCSRRSRCSAAGSAPSSSSIPTCTSRGVRAAWIRSWTRTCSRSGNGRSHAPAPALVLRGASHSRSGDRMPDLAVRRNGGWASPGRPVGPARECPGRRFCCWECAFAGVGLRLRQRPAVGDDRVPADDRREHFDRCSADRCGWRSTSTVRVVGRRFLAA